MNDPQPANAPASDPLEPSPAHVALTCSKTLASETRALERERRQMVEKLMQEWEQDYFYPRLRDIQARCAALGHKWRFSGFGPLGDPWYRCSTCNAAECRLEER